MWRIEQPALLLLRRILLHIPSHRKLATVLQDNPLPNEPRFAALKDKLSDLIKSYIKVIGPGSFLQGLYLTCQLDCQLGVQIFNNMKQMRCGGLGRTILMVFSLRFCLEVVDAHEVIVV